MTGEFFQDTDIPMSQIYRAMAEAGSRNEQDAGMVDIEYSDTTTGVATTNELLEMLVRISQVLNFAFNRKIDVIGICEVMTAIELCNLTKVGTGVCLAELCVYLKESYKIG